MRVQKRGGPSLVASSTGSIGPCTVASGLFAIQGNVDYRDEHFFALTRAETVTENGYAVANVSASTGQRRDAPSGRRSGTLLSP